MAQFDLLDFRSYRSATVRGRQDDREGDLRMPRLPRDVVGVRIYRAIVIVILLVCVYAVGLGTGYVIGYADDYKIEVIKYRRGHR